MGRRDDRGGNSIKVTLFGQETNLHSVWDAGLIDSEKLSFSEFAAFIDHPTLQELQTWQGSAPADWANESKAVRDQVYDDRRRQAQLRLRVPADAADQAPARCKRASGWPACSTRSLRSPGRHCRTVLRTFPAPGCRARAGWRASSVLLRGRSAELSGISLS